MKEVLGLLDNTLNAAKGEHEVNRLLLVAEDSHGGKLAEAATYVYQRAVEAAVNALECAKKSKNLGMQARIEAVIGNIYFRCLHKTEAEKLPLLRRAAEHYGKMLTAAGVILGGPGHDNVLGEPWFQTAKADDLELKNEIRHLERATEAAALAEAKPKIDLAKAKYEEDTSEIKLAFITWINETYVPEDKRKPMPGVETTSVKGKFARWYVGNITKHIHPDNFVNESTAKIIEMYVVSSLSNKILNKLKGHT